MRQSSNNKDRNITFEIIKVLPFPFCGGLNNVRKDFIELNKFADALTCFIYWNRDMLLFNYDHRN